MYTPATPPLCSVPQTPPREGGAHISHGGKTVRLSADRLTPRPWGHSPARGSHRRRTSNCSRLGGPGAGALPPTTSPIGEQRPPLSVPAPQTPPVCAGPHIDVARAALLLDVTEARVRTMLRTQVLPGYKVCGSWKVSLDAVERRRQHPPRHGRPRAEACASCSVL